MFERMNNLWKLYEFIDKHPNLTGYELSKRMKWSIKKTKRYLKKLIRDGLIIMINRGYKSKDWKDL